MHQLFLCVFSVLLFSADSEEQHIEPMRGAAIPLEMLYTPHSLRSESFYFFGVFSVESRTAFVMIAAVAFFRSSGSVQPVTFSEESHTSQIK